MLSVYIVACCKKPMRLIFDTKNLKGISVHISSLLESPVTSTQSILFRVGVKGSRVHLSAPLHANNTKSYTHSGLRARH